MDAILVIKKIIENKKLDRKEKFVSGSDNYVFAICIGIYAGYLSYECSSKHGEPIILKLLYSVLAFICGLFYLLYHFLFKHKC